MSSMFRKKTGPSIKPKFVPRGRPAQPAAATPTPPAPPPTTATTVTAPPTAPTAPTPQPANHGVSTAQRGAASPPAERRLPPSQPAKPPAASNISTGGGEANAGIPGTGDRVPSTAAASQGPAGVDQVTQIQQKAPANETRTEQSVAELTPPSTNTNPATTDSSSHTISTPTPRPLIPLTPDATQESTSSVAPREVQLPGAPPSDPSGTSVTPQLSATAAPSTASLPTPSTQPATGAVQPTPATPSASQPAAEAAKKPTPAKRSRKRTAEQVSTDQPQPLSGEPLESIEPAPTPAKRPRQRKKQTQSETPDGTEGAQPKPKRQRKKRQAEDGAVEGDRPRRRQSRARSETPPGAEDEVVDIQKLKMSDLTRDLRIGKKFSRHDELRARERQERARSSGAASKSSQSPAPGAPGQAQAASGTGGASVTSTLAGSGPQFQIVNGQIVVDQSSLALDRHARDAIDGPIEEIEENEFTHRVTSNSYRTGSKLRGPNHWSAEDTEKFYGYLKQFGTDFTILSSLFPGRQRRHLKMKFNREERFARERIDSALMGPKESTMTFEEYQAVTGGVYEETEDIHAELKRDHDEREAALRAVEEADEELNRQRLEAIHGTGKKGGRKKKEESVAPKI